MSDVTEHQIRLLNRELFDRDKQIADLTKQLRQAQADNAAIRVGGVKQTTFGDKLGNCQQAALATLLGVAIDEVPNACVDTPPGGDWQLAINEFLHDRFGMAMLWLDLDDAGALPDMNALPDNVPCIIGGKSHRGHNHAIVGMYRRTRGEHWLDATHDPHPDNTYLVKPAGDVAFLIVGQPLLDRMAKLEKLATAELAYRKANREFSTSHKPDATVLNAASSAVEEALDALDVPQDDATEGYNQGEQR